MTLTERYLAKLARHSFLRLWSYPNVYRDQGILAGGDGKEVVDLLVVFGRDILLFSDKDCEYPSTGNEALDWSRWFKRAVARSADQLRGAQRWIEQHPTRVFLDRLCKQPVPLPLDTPGLRFHRIVVAHDRTGRRASAIGGSGSLMINPSVVGSTDPHMVGLSHAGGSFCHIWDEQVLALIMQHLDTATDLIDYLVKKEQFFLSGELGMAAGEEELLALYLRDVGPDQRHYFKNPKPGSVLFLDEGFWTEFVQSGPYRRYLIANQPSYRVDRLIDSFAAHAINGTLYRNDDQRSLRELEVGLRILAAEPRVGRRMLAKAILGALTVAGQADLFRILPSTTSERRFYLLYVCRRLPDEDYDRYRERRAEVLMLYAEWQAGRKLPIGVEVVGLAIDGGAHLGGPSSEDLMHIPDLSVEANRKIAVEEAARVFGWGKDQREVRISEKEYPDPQEPTKTVRKVGRNERCPCGSGTKFKKCCWRP